MSYSFFPGDEERDTAGLYRVRNKISFSFHIYVQTMVQSYDQLLLIVEPFLSHVILQIYSRAIQAGNVVDQHSEQMHKLLSYTEGREEFGVLVQTTRVHWE